MRPLVMEAQADELHEVDRAHKEWPEQSNDVDKFSGIDDGEDNKKMETRDEKTGGLQKNLPHFIIVLFEGQYSEISNGKQFGATE